MKIEAEKKYGSWSGAEVEAFLTETLLPLRVSISAASGPLIVPLWFEYQDGCLSSCSPADSLLVNSISDQPNVAFDVSTNDLPYRGVRGRGRARYETTTDSTTLAGLLTRYLGGTDSQLAGWLLNRQQPEALIEIEINWLTSWDFTERMGDIDPISARAPDSPL